MPLEPFSIVKLIRHRFRRNQIFHQTVAQRVFKKLHISLFQPKTKVPLTWDAKFDNYIEHDDDLRDSKMALETFKKVFFPI